MTLVIEIGVGTILLVMCALLFYRSVKQDKRLDVQGDEIIEMQKVMIGLHKEVGRLND